MKWNDLPADFTRKNSNQNFRVTQNEPNKIGMTGHTIYNMTALKEKGRLIKMVVNTPVFLKKINHWGNNSREKLLHPNDYSHKPTVKNGIITFIIVKFYYAALWFQISGALLWTRDPSIWH